MSFWSDDKVATLTRYWRAGYSGSACGRILGCSRAAAIAKAGRLGLGPHAVEVHERRPKTARHKAGRAFQFRRPAKPSQRRLTLVKTKPKPDFSWHLARIAEQGEARNIAPPAGLLSWRSFRRIAAEDAQLRAQVEAAIQSRREMGCFRRKKAA